MILIKHSSGFHGLPLDLFHVQKKFISDLLGQNLLKKLSNKKGDSHPALEIINICDQIINQGEIIKWPEDRNKIDKILALVLDNYIITKCSNGNINSFTLGNFNQYGYSEVQKKLFTRLEDRIHFLSLMTEFSCASFYFNNPNYQVTALYEDSLPDFKLISISPPCIIAFECKRMLTNTINKKNIKKDLEKANKQIKCYSERIGKQICGVMALDLSSAIKPPKVTLSQHQNSIPTSVSNVKNLIKDLIKKNYTSISGVLIIWNEYQQIENHPETQFTFHRRGVFIPHRNPNLEIIKGAISEDNWGYK